MSGPIDCCTRYDCVDGVCRPGATGFYDNLAACEEACMGCVLLCDQCPDGISSQWQLTVTGYLPITVIRHGDPDDDNQCRFFSHDLLWEMSYEPGTDQWVVVNNETNVSWVLDGADWNCAGPNLLENNTDDPVEAAAVSQCYSYNCVSGGSGGSGGGCVQVPGTEGTYSTLVACQAICTPIETECCPNPVPRSVPVTISGTGDCGACADGQAATAVYDAAGTSGAGWYFTTTVCGVDYAVSNTFVWRCESGNMVMDLVASTDPAAPAPFPYRLPTITPNSVYQIAISTACGAGAGTLQFVMGYDCGAAYTCASPYSITVPSTTSEHITDAVGQYVFLFTPSASTDYSFILHSTDGGVGNNIHGQVYTLCTGTPIFDGGDFQVGICGTYPLTAGTPYYIKVGLTDDGVGTWPFTLQSFVNNSC